jgi:hypothetical protein
MKKFNFILAMLFTTGFAMAQNNDASITQIGDVHDATISQGGDLNKAYVKQTADLGREGSDLGEATVTQQGLRNLVRLEQRAFYGDAYAKIIQWGDDNKVYGVSEDKSFYQNHGFNSLDVYMEGDRNTLKTLYSEAQKNDNNFELKVIGDDNTTKMSQHFGLADVDVDGDWNDVTVEQKSGQPSDMVTRLDFNDADIDILGNLNLVDVFQNDLNNTAIVDIKGSSNEAFITQTGSQVYP